MPYSETLNLVHIAIPKTGSTSMVRALYKLHELKGGTLTLHKEAIDDAFIRTHRLDELPGRPSGRAKHLSAAHLQRVLGNRYSAAFSFTCVRNPWARALSRYFFTHESNAPSPEERLRRGTTRTFHRLEFPDWINRMVREAGKRGRANNQIDKLTSADGKIIVNHIGRLEAVNETFSLVCRYVGVDPFPVPHVNTTGSRPKYVHFYDDRTRDAVADLCHLDIEAFGYKFGD